MEDAVSAADEGALETKEADCERAVVEALLVRARMPHAMTRRVALLTLADCACNARIRGDNKCVQAFIDALEDEDTLVKTAAVTSLRKVALRSDERAVEALSNTALHDTEWQTRKSAIEALEAVALPGNEGVVEVFQELTRDKNSWIREAAVKALEILAPEADPRSIATASHTLHDSAWEVRRSAARTLMMLEPEGDGQDTVGPKVFGREDKSWFKMAEGYLRKPLFMPLR